LYFEGLRKGIAPQTATDPLIRARLTERAEHEGHSVLHAALERVDPESARRIHVNDLQRTVRALVVYEQTGTPASEWRRRTCPPVDMVFDVAVIMPPRDELYKRIDRRVDDMATRGLYDEFLQLLRNGFDSRSPGMQCIGYRELFGIRSGAYDMATAIERIKRNTRHFARRQYTWFNAHNRTEFVSWRREKPDCRRGVAAGTDYAILANDVRQLYTYDEGKKNNTK
ncbi:MAG: hypothetical protein JXA71_20400, partial [Chitinispirillaceae bacterium]|nr:hypothetical protein [Chitinispirillaceae bacterium]